MMRWIALMAGFGLLLAACSSPVLTPTAIRDETATPEPIPEPSSTPDQSLMLIAEGEPTLAEPLREWAAGRNWQLLLAAPQEAERLLSEAQVEPIAIVSLQVPLASDLAAPQVLVEVEGASPQLAVSTVGEPGARHDQAGFLAGVITGLTSQTGWVGLVEGSGSELEPQQLEGFDQGLRFSCPRCRLVRFSASEVSVDGFRGQGVDVVFVVPGDDSAEITGELGVAGLWIVWIGELPAGSPIASIAGRVGYRVEPLLLAALEALIQGEPGSAWPYAIENGGISLAEMNVEAISPGRQRLVQEAYHAVASGELAIGTTGQ